MPGIDSKGIELRIDECARCPACAGGERLGTSVSERLAYAPMAAYAAAASA